MTLTRRSILGGAARLLAVPVVAPLVAACRPDLPDPEPLPAPAYTTRVEGDVRIVECNGVPTHEVGRFPNHGCPIPIRPVPHRYQMPAAPTPAAAITPIGWSEVGIATTGVPFDPAGPYLEGDSHGGWRFEVMSTGARRYLGLDLQNAHVQPSGAYHYHGVGAHFVAQARAARAAGTPLFLGWAADGFPIYGPFGYQVADDPTSPLVLVRPSYARKTGARPGGPGGDHDGTFVEDFAYQPGLGDLDEANGRFGATPAAPAGEYHYVATSAFPFLPRYFRGTPDPSFNHVHGDPGIAAVPPALRGYHG